MPPDRARSRADGNLTLVSGSPSGSGPRFDLPTIEDESEPYWAALRDGKFLLKRCSACGEHHFYPRPFCPHCWSDDVEWVEAGGAEGVDEREVVFVELSLLGRRREGDAFRHADQCRQAMAAASNGFGDSPGDGV